MITTNNNGLHVEIIRILALSIKNFVWIVRPCEKKLILEIPLLIAVSFSSLTCERIQLSDLCIDVSEMRTSTLGPLKFLRYYFGCWITSELNTGSVKRLTTPSTCADNDLKSDKDENYDAMMQATLIEYYSIDKDDGNSAVAKL